MGRYNLKNIMLGIGIGLIIASIANINKGDREMTVEEIRKEAQKHDLIVLTVDEIINKQAPSAAPATTPTTAPSAAAAPTTAPVPTAESKAVPNPTPTPARTTSDQKAEINIQSGMSSEKIAELLEVKGLINDKKSFLKRLGELGKDDKLKVGTYELVKGTGIDELITILTR